MTQIVQQKERAVAKPLLPGSLNANRRLSQWVQFHADKRVTIHPGKVEIGQGILTALAQIAAEELDVAPEQLRIVSGETDISPAEGFTSGSYSVAVGGASIRLVCAQVRSLYLDRLADTLGCPLNTALARMHEGLKKLRLLWEQSHA